MKIFKSKKEKELEFLLKMWWKEMYVLSVFKEKNFVEFMKNRLKEYDKLKGKW